MVTILCDTGERYLSKLYDDTWMRENQMMAAERVTAGELLRRHPEEVPPLVSVVPPATSARRSTCSAPGASPSCRWSTGTTAWAR